MQCIVISCHPNSTNRNACRGYKAHLHAHNGVADAPKSKRRAQLASNVVPSCAMGGCAPSVDAPVSADAQSIEGQTPYKVVDNDSIAATKPMLCGRRHN